ncbi:MAG: type IV pilus modification protein PilV [Gammaproteobacteria bacterium]|nr:type IV pilus modification protein PilV [Gammaproteobacteria bacterium]
MSLDSEQIANMQKQTGFTLIEILVTVIVLSIGLLGLAGLQAVALKFNSTAYQRSQATVLIYDMIERVRSNSGTDRVDYLSCILGGACMDPTVQTDIQQWNNMIGQNLPSGNGLITRCSPNSVPPCPANTYVFSVTWDDSRGQDALRNVEIRTNL